MATVTHIICSHYDPADRERLEVETGQVDEDHDPWQTESSFSAQRHLRAAPAFVPATISYDEWGAPLTGSEPSQSLEESDQPSTSTSEWYRSLTASTSAREAPPRPSSAPGPGSRVSRPPEKPRREIITKNNWFISKVLRSEPNSKPSSPTPSLADLLARDPPPLPSEERYKPPVWLHIGPSNKGWSMLQQSGWNEGEGLGAHVARPPLTRDSDDATASPVRRSASGMRLSSVKAEETTADIQDVREVIDLTQSDSDESEDGFEDHITVPAQTQAAQEIPNTHTQKSLLTPLPTILKADRLGIGLKAKTEGPYKQSKKRVTHNAAALAAHIRSAEEMRRKKAEVGRGKRGFSKIRKREEERRKAMLAYLND